MADDLGLSLTDSPPATDVDRLRQGLTEHSRPFVDAVKSLLKKKLSS